MAESNNQRQANWRARRDLKSAFFDDFNADRIARLHEQYSKIEKKSPEFIDLATFFFLYPRCHTLPTLVLRKNWWIVVSDETLTDFERAAADVAMGEISSLPLQMVGGPTTEARLLVHDEVDRMRRLGMWNRNVLRGV